MRTIKSKITLLILSMVILTIIIMVSVVYNYSLNELVEQAENNNVSHVKNLKDYYLSGLVEEMEYVSNYWSNYDEIVNYEKAENQEKMTNRIPENFLQLHRDWMALINSNRDITWMYLGLEEDGSIFIAPIDKTMPDEYDCRERGWYIDAVETDGMTWSDPYIDAGESGKVLVTVARPVKKNGELVGVIGLDIALEELSGILQELSYGNTGQFLVVDSNGNIMAHSDKEMILKPYEYIEDGTLKISGKTQNLKFSDNKSIKLITMMPIEGSSWSVIGESTEDLSNMIYENFSYILIISIFILILVIVLSKNLSEKLTEPIYDIYKVVRKVEGGDFSVRSKNSSNDEIGKLSKGIDNMLDEIQELMDLRKSNYEELISKNEEIESYSSQMKAINDELRSILSELDESYFDTVKALANSIEASDHYTRGHCDRVQDISMKIAKRVNFDYKQLKNLSYACVLHDIGKIGISPELLNKTEKLTDEELEVIRTHPTIGFEIIKDIAFLKESSNIILQHHEREDGKGYPFKLLSEEILPEAKILSIADAYDAMTSKRPYRKNVMRGIEALNELIRHSNTQFNLEYVLILKEILEEEMNEEKYELENDNEEQSS